MILGGGNKSIQLVDVVGIHSDLIQEVEVEVLRVGFAAQLHLLVLEPTHSIKLQLFIMVN